MPLTSPRELFVHELADMISAEQIVLKLLPELQREALDQETKSAFKEHATETRAQLKRLHDAFKELGEKPEETTCHAAEGLQQEHQALHQERPTPEVLELGNLVGAAKTEHYEIASYAALVQMAKNLGEREVARLLQETLDEEKAMAKRVEALAKDLGKAIEAAELSDQAAAS
jgi:ferritin-like metal-binding protein YciE